MDSRLIPENMFGFKLGDAEIIRNAGGRVNSDVIRFASHNSVPAFLWPLQPAVCCLACSCVLELHIAFAAFRAD